jgi:hypothetical protein
LQKAFEPDALRFCFEHGQTVYLVLHPLPDHNVLGFWVLGRRTCNFEYAPTFGLSLFPVALVVRAVGEV